MLLHGVEASVSAVFERTLREPGFGELETDVLFRDGCKFGLIQR